MYIKKTEYFLYITYTLNQYTLLGQMSIFECHYCFSKFVNYINMNKHLGKKHPYRCFRCKIYFSSKKKYNRHQRCNHLELDGGISKERKYVKKNNKVLVPIVDTFNKKGACWCYTCNQWSSGCKNKEHDVCFVPFD